MEGHGYTFKVEPRSTITFTRVHLKQFKGT